MYRDKSEAVLPPLRTLAAYGTQKFVISLGRKHANIELPLRKGETTPFHPKFLPFFLGKGEAKG